VTETLEWWIIAQAIISGLLVGGVYSLISLGLTLVYGVMGIINFAHCDLMMFAMYGTYWMFTLWGIDPFVSIIFTVPILFLIGVTLQKLLVNRVLDAPHMNQLFLMLGLVLITENLALLMWKANARAVITSYSTSTIKLNEVFIGVPQLLSFFVAVAFAALLYLFISRTKIGRAMRATAQNKMLSSASGVNVSRMYILAFGIGAACVGVAGSLLSTYFYVTPTVGATFTPIVFSAVVLGGLGSFTGAFLGGLILGLAQSLGSLFISSYFGPIAALVVFIIILIFKPNGLLGKRST
jgi:branched-chain amino acid transport system permease protein